MIMGQIAVLPPSRQACRTDVPGKGVAEGPLRRPREAVWERMFNAASGVGQGAVDAAQLAPLAAVQVPVAAAAAASGYTMAELREYLARHYETLSRQLAARVGGLDLAREALHEVWLRLSESMEQGGGLRQVERPGAYLARMAYHAAIDRLRQDEPLRGSPQGDEDYLQSLPDPSAGIEHIVAGRNALRVLVDSIDALPRRRQAIFVAIRLEALSHNEVARRFGLSLAVVRGELRKAHAHCAQALQWDGFGA